VLATATADASVRLWDPATGQIVASAFATGHVGAVNAIGSVPMPYFRTALVTAGGEGSVRLWDPMTGGQLSEPLMGHTGPMSALTVISIDGRPLLATVGQDPTIRLWDPATGHACGEPLETDHTGAVNAIATVPMPDEGIALATGSDDGTVRLWDPNTRQRLGGPLTGHTDAIFALAVIMV
jgi:WD40 repeat protein